jgi:hypothetical protein
LGQNRLFWGCFGGDLTLLNRLSPQAPEKQNLPVVYRLFPDWGGRLPDNSTLLKGSRIMIMLALQSLCQDVTYCNLITDSTFQTYHSMCKWLVIKKAWLPSSERTGHMQTLLL